MGLWSELRRRHMFRITAVYAATGWLVLQLGAIVFPALHAPSWCLPVLIGFVALGFPVALVLAWAFEITPDGVRRTQPGAAGEGGTAGHRRRVGAYLNGAIIAILASAVALLLWRQFGLLPRTAARSTAVHTAAAIPERSIAVLPFANDSGDPDQRYFSDGLTEDLIIALNQYSGLKVIGRESSFRFRDTDLDSRTIGRKLGVAHLLEGSVSRLGDTVRIRAELVNAGDGSTVWSRHYDRPYKDLFALQDAITRAVADALKTRLKLDNSAAVLQTDRPPSGNLEAYNAYLKGNYYAGRFVKADFFKAIDEYGKAIKLDPDYAAAYAARSYALAYVGGVYLGGKQLRDALARARADADRALALDPDLAAAHRARGMILRSAWQWTAAVAEFRRALELAPTSPRAMSDLASGLSSIGHHEESVKLQKRALAENPLDSHGYLRLSLFLFALHRFDEGAKAALQAIALDSDSPYRYALVLNEVGKGDGGAALRTAEQEKNPIGKYVELAFAWAAVGDEARADQALKDVIAHDGDIMPLRIADVYAYRGNRDQAIAWLAKAVRMRTPDVQELLTHPFLLRCRNDPRFVALREKVGLPAAAGTPAAATP